MSEPTFPVTVELPVQWGEMDAFGHVNNVTYFRYFEHARLAYFHAMGLPGWGTPKGLGPILHSTRARYRRPLRWPDTLDVDARVAAVEDDRFTMQFRVRSRGLGEVAAEGDAIVVVYDYDRRHKAPVSPEIRDAIARVERARAEERP